MERLTEWIGEHRAIPRTDLRRCGHDRCTTRLAEYEDIGLTVEQVQQLKELNTPIRPELEADGYADGELVYDTWICPNCKTSYEVDYDRYFYCPNCGQKIKWSE